MANVSYNMFVCYSLLECCKGLRIFQQPSLLPDVIRAKWGCPQQVTIFPGKVCLLEMWYNSLLHISSSLSGSPSACLEHHQIWLQMEGIKGLMSRSSFFGLMARIFFLMDLDICQTSNWWIFSLWSVLISTNLYMPVCNHYIHWKICSLNASKWMLEP